MDSRTSHTAVMRLKGDVEELFKLSVPGAAETESGLTPAKGITAGAESSCSKPPNTAPAALEELGAMVSQTSNGSQNAELTSMTGTGPNHFGLSLRWSDPGADRDEGDEVRTACQL